MRTTHAARVGLSALGIAASSSRRAAAPEVRRAGRRFRGSARPSPRPHRSRSRWYPAVRTLLPAWKAAGAQAKTDLGLGGMAFDETGQWDQAKQNAALNSLAARGTTHGDLRRLAHRHQQHVLRLKSKGITSLRWPPAGRRRRPGLVLPVHRGGGGRREGRPGSHRRDGWQGVLVHLTGNNVDSNTQRGSPG